MDNHKRAARRHSAIFFLLLAMAIFISGMLRSDEASGMQVTLKNRYVTGVKQDGKSIGNEWVPIKGKEDYFNIKGTLPKSARIDSKAVGTDVVYAGEGERSFSVLSELIKTKTRSWPGTWSVYVKDLKTGEVCCVNDRKMYAASLIKLYAMAALYDCIDKGTVREKKYSRLLKKMITVSDNKSYNTIVSRIGKKKLNRWIRENGYTKTKAVHNVGLSSNNTIVRRGRKKNTTCVSDCGALLESIYRKECVSEVSSNAMLKLLMMQKLRKKIPKLLPKAVNVANKTGETNEVSHDAAIIYGPDRDYILVIMVTDPGRAWSDEKLIARLSRSIYDFMIYRT